MNAELAGGALFPERPHVLGPAQAAVTLVEFGDFGCPYCAAADRPVKDLVSRLESVQMIWRHFPDPELHPGADLAAEASEAAAEQGAFWPFHDALLGHQGSFDVELLTGLAADHGIDADRIRTALRERRFRSKVEEDQFAGRKLGVTGTPTFFIDGERVTGPWAGLRKLLPAAVERTR
ncbi:MAG: DsbA family protein [Actinomycetota bacterium]|nr:DsbA family protein [Actinomycetota bacterium]